MSDNIIDFMHALTITLELERPITLLPEEQRQSLK